MAKPRDELLRKAARKHYEKQKLEGKTKLQVWLDPQGVAALEYLLADAPGMSKADVVNRALRLCQLAVEEEKRERARLEDGTGEFPA